MKKTPIVPDAIYSSKEAIALLGLHRQTFLVRVKNGLIPAKLVGNKYLFNGSDLLKFLKSK